MTGNPILSTRHFSRLAEQIIDICFFFVSTVSMSFLLTINLLYSFNTQILVVLLSILSL